MAAGYDFSFVMAVYQVEDYLREAVDSIIAQNYPFERVQIILVDDGSTDSSGAICNEYAAKYSNIIALHKENGGQASARNLGLTRVEGTLISFMDPDDTLTPDTLQAVFDFFEQYGDQTDIASIPMYHFGAMTGPHWQNTKFNKGTRVIDLISEYSVQQASSSSAFFHRRVLPLLHFDERLPNCEDLRMNLGVLLRRPTLGVVSKARYMYRKRANGTSTVDGLTKKKAWYFDTYTYLSEAVCREANELIGFVPHFVQYAILCDLQWRFRSDYSAAMAEVLTEEEQAAYIRRTGEIMQLFDDECILSQPGMNNACKCLMLRMKHGRLPDLLPTGSDLVLHFGNTIVSRVSWAYTKLHFLTEQGHTLHLEGSTVLSGLPEDEPVQVFLATDDTLIPCEPVDRSAAAVTRLGLTMQRTIGFLCHIDVDALPDPAVLHVVLRIRGLDIPVSALENGRFMPLSSWVKGSSCVIAGRRLTMQKNALILDRQTGRISRMKDELRLLKNLYTGKS